MKKELRVCIFFILILFSSHAFGAKSKKTTTDLEKIWEIVRQKNLDVNAAERENNLVKRQIDGYWKNYMPSVNMSSSASFTESETDYGKCPSSVNAALGMVQTLPGGVSLTVSPNVSFTKGLADYERESSISNVKYTDRMSLGMYVSQKLEGSYFKANGSDLGMRRLKTERKMKELAYFMTLQNKIEEVTKNYINLRQTVRNVEAIKSNIEFYSKLVSSLYESVEKGNSSKKDVFSAEENLYENEQNLKENYVNLQNLYKNLENLLNFSLIFDENYEKKCIFDELPDLEKLKSLENFYGEYLKLQKNLAEMDYFEARQSTSPVFSIGFSIPIHDGSEEDSFASMIAGGKKQWEVSAGIDFGNFFSRNNDFLSEKLLENREKTEEFIRNYENSVKNEQNFYEKSLKSSEAFLKLYEKNLENTEEHYDSLVILFENNACSGLDLLQIKTEVFTKKLQLENLKDEIWLYKWLLKNREQI